MDEDPLWAGRPAIEKLTQVSEQLELLLKACLINDGAENREIFMAAWAAVWAEHRATTLQCFELAGMSLELAELKWRDYRAGFDPVDPCVPLTASERATLTRLQAAHQAEQQAELEELRRQKRVSNDAE